MAEEKLTEEKIPEDKKHKYGEQILLIYKLLESLISKNEILFSNSEMKNYCRTVWLKFLEKKMIGEAIDKIINQFKYYLQK